MRAMLLDSPATPLRLAEVSDPEPAPGAAIIFAPAGELVPLALRATAKGATVVCAGIHMSDIPSFAYRDLWGERTVRSVANEGRIEGAAALDLRSSDRRAG